MEEILAFILAVIAILFIVGFGGLLLWGTYLMIKEMTEPTIKIKLYGWWDDEDN